MEGSIAHDTEKQVVHSPPADTLKPPEQDVKSQAKCTKPTLNKSRNVKEQNPKFRATFDLHDFEQANPEIPARKLKCGSRN